MSRFHLLGMLLIIGWGTGCTSVQQISIDAHDRFRNEMSQSCLAIRSFDFSAARKHLEHARSLADSPFMVEKVNDLDQICAGGTALEAGQVHVAASHWMAIRDPGLRHQLVTIASHQGIDLETLARSPRPEFHP